MVQPSGDGPAFDAAGQAWRHANQVPSAARGVGPQHVHRRVLDQMPDQRAEWFQRHGGAVLARPVEHDRRSLVPYRAGERAQHGRLADPRLALHDDRPQARPAYLGRLRGQQLQLAGSSYHGRPPRQLGLQRQPAVPAPGR